MRAYNIHEAKTHLSQLVDEAVAETVCDCQAQQGLVEVIPMNVPDAPIKRRIGAMKGYSHYRTTSKK